jgi:hypothetical protein
VEGAQSFPRRAASPELHAAFLHDLHDVRVRLQVVDEGRWKKGHIGVGELLIFNC